MLKNFNRIKKNEIFWYSLVPQLLLVTLAISLSPWLIEWLATPLNQVFSGINRWSTDYYIYLSYVEIGRRGQLSAMLLSTTVKQFPVFAHLAHTLPGYLFGHLLGFSSVASYHLARGIYGMLFLISALSFFYLISKSKIISFLAFVFTFYFSGFPKLDSLKPLHFSRYVDWMAEQNIIGRPTIPLHYSASIIFFIFAFVIFFIIRTSFLKRIIVFGFMLNLVLLANPFAYIIIGFSFGLYALIRFITSVNKKLFIKQEFFTIFFGFILTLPLFFL